MTLERAHGKTERYCIERRAKRLVKQEFDRRVSDIEVWLGQGVRLFGRVERRFVGGGGGGEGSGGGAEGVGGEGGFEELLPVESGGEELVWYVGGDWGTGKVRLFGDVEGGARLTDWT